MSVHPGNTTPEPPAHHTPSSLSGAANTVLRTADAHAKCAATSAFAAQWRDGRITLIGDTPPPDRPSRPAKPALLPPSDVPRRKINRGTAGRIAQLHALAHIELNAVDLAWDIIARFTARDLPRAFYDDWVEANFNVDAPGATSANLKTLGHTVCSRPIYPLEEDTVFDPKTEVFSRA